jgi:hypothetical protein
MKLNMINIIFLSCMIIILSSCKQEKNILTLSANPVIDSITLPEKWNTRLELLYKVEVKVLDAQGFANIDTVRMNVVDPDNSALIFTDNLHDDGAFYYPQDGDVLAGDGVYSNKFYAAQIVSAQSTAEYTIQFTAIDKQGNLSIVQDRSVLFSPNYPPVIGTITAPDTFAVPRLRPVINMTVSDNDGISDITQAYFESQAVQGQARIFESDLFNDGNYELHGDEVAGDSVFSVRLDSAFMVDKKGSYLLWFHVLDSFLEKNEVVPWHELYVANTPPQIVDINLPEVMERPAASGAYKLGFLTAQVVDDQGLADIDSVYFYSRKPDSTLANNGNYFVLVDNGLPFNLNQPLEQGDLQSGDGIYSYSLLVYNTAALGTYTFTFYARDKAGNFSAVQSRTLTIVDNSN